MTHSLGEWLPHPYGSQQGDIVLDGLSKCKEVLFCLMEITGKVHFIPENTLRGNMYMYYYTAMDIGSRPVSGGPYLLTVQALHFLLNF